MRCLGPLLPLAGAALAFGQEPAFRHTGRQEGLPHEQVRCLQQDGRGYLWIGTGGRICRHDGSAVREWPADAAVPERIDRMAVDANGRVFLGCTGPSILVYDPFAQPCFARLEVRGDGLGRNIAALAVDGRQRLYAATETGLFVADVTGRECALRAVHRDERDLWYGALATDHRGRLLYARSGLAVRIDGDDEIAVDLPPGGGNAWAIEPVDDGKYRVLEDWRLWEIDFATRSRRALPLPSPADKRCTALCIDRRGTTWLGTVEGLWRFGDGVPAERVVADAWIQSLCVDRAGDVWVGTQQNGLLRASARPFSQLRASGANGAVRPVKLLRIADAALVASHTKGLYRVDGRTLQPTRSSANAELRTGSGVLADASGNLWFATGQALLQMAARQLDDAATSLQRWPIAVRRLSLGGRGHALCTTDDAVITMVPGGDGAMQMERQPLPPDLAGGVAIAGDGGQIVYVRTRSGELWRLWAAGVEPCTDRGERLLASAVHQDRDGRLWILPANRTGFAIADPRRGAALDVRWIDAADGLPGSRVMALTLDAGGGAWLALAAALCHFDTSTGRVASWPWPADAGLAAVHGMLIDPGGRVLVATDDHLVAFAPAAQLATGMPTVLVTSLLVAGVPVPVADGGTAVLDPLSVPAGRGDLIVSFCAPGSAIGAAPVQYRLVPSVAEFSAPLLGTTLQLAGLAPGDYRLELRAAAFDDLPPGPATVIALRVQKPLWARSEFFAAVAVLAILAGVLLHRLRVRQLLAMEAVRRQVATDLHDDLGSGLAQVAILSEVVKRRAPPLAGVLDEIGGLARGMRESLSDIVWAVDPTKDTLSAVVNRLHQVAGNLFGEGTTAVQWTAPAAAEMDAVTLRPDRRRHLFLFCKEALSNAARHAEARTVTIAIVRSPGGLRIAMVDDGCGFDPTASHAGNGLRSLQARAAALGAVLSLRSAPGHGTTILLEVPVR